MKLVQWIAVELYKSGSGWPEGAVEVEQSDYEVTWLDAAGHYVDSIECDGVFEWQGEYGDAVRCSKEKYDEFISTNPDYAQHILRRRQEVVKEIATLTACAKHDVSRIVELSDEVGIPVSISFDCYGCIEPNGRDWNESRC